MSSARTILARRRKGPCGSRCPRLAAIRVVLVRYVHFELARGLLAPACSGDQEPISGDFSPRDLFGNPGHGRATPPKWGNGIQRQDSFYSGMNAPRLQVRLPGL